MPTAPPQTTSASSAFGDSRSLTSQLYQAEQNSKAVGSPACQHVGRGTFDLGGLLRSYWVWHMLPHCLHPFLSRRAPRPSANAYPIPIRGVDFYEVWPRPKPKCVIEQSRSLSVGFGPLWRLRGRRGGPRALLRHGARAARRLPRAHGAHPLCRGSSAATHSISFSPRQT